MSWPTHQVREQLSPRTIRHTTATHLLRSGVGIYTIRAWTLEKMEDWSRALNDYVKAVALGSHEAHDLANCGRVRCHLGEYEAAIEDYTRALQRPSPEAVLYAERGNAYLALKRFPPALQDFRAALKLDGSLRSALGPLIAQCDGAGPPK